MAGRTDDRTLLIEALLDAIDRLERQRVEDRRDLATVRDCFLRTLDALHLSLAREKAKDRRIAQLIAVARRLRSRW